MVTDAIWYCLVSCAACPLHRHSLLTAVKYVLWLLNASLQDASKDSASGQLRFGTPPVTAEAANRVQHPASPPTRVMRHSLLAPARRNVGPIVTST